METNFKGFVARLKSQLECKGVSIDVICDEDDMFMFSLDESRGYTYVCLSPNNDTSYKITVTEDMCHSLDTKLVDKTGLIDYVLELVDMSSCMDMVRSLCISDYCYAGISDFLEYIFYGAEMESRGLSLVISIVQSPMSCIITYDGVEHYLSAEIKTPFDKNTVSTSLRLNTMKECIMAIEHFDSLVGVWIKSALNDCCINMQ